MSKPIKPCPFCGSSVAEDDTGLGEQGGRKYYIVVCPNCEANGPDASTEAIAFAAWNNRYTLDSAPPEGWL